MPLDSRSFSYWSDADKAWGLHWALIGVGPSSQALPLRAVIAQGGASCRRRGSA